MRGTQVAGQVSGTNDSQVVLVGPTQNSFGLTPGRISVSNAERAVNIERPGFLVSISQGIVSNARPAPDDTINALNESLTIQAQTETEMPTVESVNSSIDQAITAANATGANPTNVGSTDEVTRLMFGDDADRPVDNAGNAMVSTYNFGRDTAQLIANGTAAMANSEFILVPLDRAIAPELTGSAVYKVLGGHLSDGWNPSYGNRSERYCVSNPCGSYDMATTFDFDTDTVRMEVDGNVEGLRIASELGHNVSFDFAFEGTASLEDASHLNEGWSRSLTPEQETIPFVNAATRIYVESETPGAGGELVSGAAKMISYDRSGRPIAQSNNMAKGDNYKWTIGDLEVRTDGGLTPTNVATRLVLGASATPYNVPDGFGNTLFSGANLAVEVKAHVSAAWDPSDYDTTAAVANGMILNERPSPD